MSEFYSFNLNYEHQLRTNWCWCACFSWIVKKFETNETTKEQWEILKYSVGLTNPEIKVKDLTETVVLTNDKYNRTLDLKIWNNVEQLIKYLTGWNYDVENVAEQGNTKYINTSDLLSFENVKSILTNNNAPILVSTLTHMFVISGFGSNDCADYILISDPFSDNAQRFFRSDIFLENYMTEIYKVWMLKNNNDKFKLSQDEYMCQFQALKDKIVANVGEDSLLGKDIQLSLELVLPVLQHKIWATMIDYQGSTSSELKSQIFEIINKFFRGDYCAPRIPRREVLSQPLFEQIITSYFLGNNQAFLNGGHINLFRDLEATFKMEILEKEDVLFGKIANEVLPYGTAIQSILTN